jgi:hypothetical protein
MAVDKQESSTFVDDAGSIITGSGLVLSLDQLLPILAVLGPSGSPTF